MLMTKQVANKIKHVSSEAKGSISGYCFKYIDRPFCLRTDDYNIRLQEHVAKQISKQNKRKAARDVVKVARSV